MNIDDKIKSWLTELNRNSNNPWPDEVKNEAPHKPFLLLSIIDGVEQGWIKNNKIKLSPELNDAFFRYWKTLMGERTTRIKYPFKHLDDPYWIYKNEKLAEIDTELFSVLKSPDGRNKVRKILLEEHFTQEAAFLLSETGAMSSEVWKYASELNEGVNDEFIAIKSSKGKKEISEVERQKRDRAFGTIVRINYNHFCTVCGKKVMTKDGASLVEAAHIIPWSKSFNDDPRNGISLCRNHHWLFDKYMLTIRNDYTVQLSPWLKRKPNKWDEYRNISDSEILLPSDSKFYPAVDALKYHNKEYERVHKDI